MKRRGININVKIRFLKEKPNASKNCNNSSKLIQFSRNFFFLNFECKSWSLC